MEALIKRMMIEDPYYGFLLTTIERAYSDEVPTLGVTFDNRMNPRLMVNRDFFDRWNDDQKLALLKHEVLHLAFKHLVMMDSFADKELFNIAADLEVNSYIKNLPEGSLFADDYGFQPRQGTWYYYTTLQSRSGGDKSKGSSGSGCCKDTGENDNGSSNGGESSTTDANSCSSASGVNKPEGKDIIDDHSVWKSIPDNMDRELASELINNKLLVAAESVKGRGHIPAELSQLISELQKPLKRVFDWKKMLRRFIGNSYDERKKSSRRKESRRFEGSCGSKHMKRSNILVGIDTSGSVSQQELHEFVSELTYMYKAGTDIYVLECDARIHKQYRFKPGCINSVSGRGGTDFDPVIDYYKQHYKQFDTLVYLTDGCAPYRHLKIPQNNMLWVISSRGSRGEYPGKTLYIPKQEN